jgi:signal transduction histidine kinase
MTPWTLGAKRPSIERDELVYRGRPLALKRLFANLIENAVRYRLDAEVQLSGGPKGVRVVVEDHGPGIPPDHLENVFKPFFRLERSRNKRPGLGLAPSRTIARAHGGATVTLPRQPDVGA